MAYYYKSQTLTIYFEPIKGVLLVTGNISPTMVLKRTIASNRFTPEAENESSNFIILHHHISQLFYKGVLCAELAMDFFQNFQVDYKTY